MALHSKGRLLGRILVHPSTFGALYAIYCALIVSRAKVAAAMLALSLFAAAVSTGLQWWSRSRPGSLVWVRASNFCCIWLLMVGCCFFSSSIYNAYQSLYLKADYYLRVAGADISSESIECVTISESSSGSYVALEPDPQGRVFVGGRESLLVFERREGNRYEAREIVRFPSDSWINDISIRGNDLYVMTSSALYL